MPTILQPHSVPQIQMTTCLHTSPYPPPVSVKQSNTISFFLSDRNNSTFFKKTVLNNYAPIAHLPLSQIKMRGIARQHSCIYIVNSALRYLPHSHILIEMYINRKRTEYLQKSIDPYAEKSGIPSPFLISYIEVHSTRSCIVFFFLGETFCFIVYFIHCNIKNKNPRNR